MALRREDQQPIADTMLTAIASIETEEINSQITIVNFDKILTVEEYNIITQLKPQRIRPSTFLTVLGITSQESKMVTQAEAEMSAEAQAVQTQIKQRLDAMSWRCCGAHCL